MALNGNKVCAIQHITVPVNITRVQSFLCMCGYYRKYSKNYQLIALPLNKLSRISEALTGQKLGKLIFKS